MKVSQHGASVRIIEKIDHGAMAAGDLGLWDLGCDCFAF